MTPIELFIAKDDAAEAYQENFEIEALEKAINENYAPSLTRKEFNTEGEKSAFQDALDFCAEECGCGGFQVILDEDVEKHRELLMDLTL